jgi:hypothetical protein
MANLALVDGIDAEVFGMALSAQADPGDVAFRTLLQRPNYETGGALRFRPSAALLFRAEYRHVGPATDLDASGNRVTLAAGDEVNLRGQWCVAEDCDRSISITIAIDNFSKDVITPQAGLLMPARCYAWVCESIDPVSVEMPASRTLGATDHPRTVTLCNKMIRTSCHEAIARGYGLAKLLMSSACGVRLTRRSRLIS